MGIRHRQKKDNKIRKGFNKEELNIISYKYIISDNYNEKLLKYLINNKYQKKFNLLFSKSRIVNRCVLTGRSRWVLRRFKMCRIIFRLNTENDKINGVYYGELK